MVSKPVFYFFQEYITFLCVVIAERITFQSSPLFDVFPLDLSTVTFS